MGAVAGRGDVREASTTRAGCLQTHAMVLQPMYCECEPHPINPGLLSSLSFTYVCTLLLLGICLPGGNSELRRRTTTHTLPSPPPHAHFVTPHRPPPAALPPSGTNPTTSRLMCTALP